MHHPNRQSRGVEGAFLLTKLVSFRDVWCSAKNRFSVLLHRTGPLEWIILEPQHRRPQIVPYSDQGSRDKTCPPKGTSRKWKGGVGRQWGRDAAGWGRTGRGAYSAGAAASGSMMTVRVKARSAVAFVTTWENSARPSPVIFKPEAGASDH
jgi:hypothetical protein